MKKVSIPKGTRDFLPLQARRRSYIFQTIKEVFELFGFAPIETPATENESTLTGKYGEEGDQLMFKVLKRGDKLKSAVEQGKGFSDLALRYDLTVPFARFVVQHQSELTFPFKRYQIQPVWRADRPQKGRYREFYQCDVDVIGSEALISEVELLSIIDQVFEKLGLSGVRIKLNNRKILAGIAQKIGAEDKFTALTVNLDKLDKIGKEKVGEELEKAGFQQVQISTLFDLLSLSGSAQQRLEALAEKLQGIEIAEKGIEELKEVMRLSAQQNVRGLELDLTLARGLNYYTGAIIEVVHDQFNSSICGGGRYDNLTEVFGLKDVSGVGISFGADRIYDLMENENLFPYELESTTKVLFVNFGPSEAAFSLSLASKLRASGISCEVYAEPAKLKKQFAYANTLNIPFVVSIGSNEMQAQKAVLKNMYSGKQTTVHVEQIIEHIV